MSLDRSDRCPNCGSPYMSTLAPGEVDNRICYSCNTAPAAPNMDAPVDDDLSIQPVDGGSGQYQATKGNVRRQMERQIRASGVQARVQSRANLPAVRKGNSNAGMPAARVASSPSMPAARSGSNPSIPIPKPAGRTTQAMPAVRTGGSTRINMPPALPSEDITATEADAVEPEAIPLEAPRVSSARMTAARSSARHRAMQEENRGGSPLKFVAVGVMVLVAGAAIYFAMGQAKTDTDAVAINTPTPSAPVIPPTTPPTSTPAPTTPTVANLRPPEKTGRQPRSVKTERPKTENVDTNAQAPAAAPAAPETAETPAATAAPAAPETVAAAPAPEKRDINAELFGNKRNPNAKMDDEEAMVELGVGKTPKKPGAAKDEQAADGKKPDALAGMGITGKKEKPQEEAPVFDDIRKPKAVIPVTATEPTIVKEDLTAGDQNPEKQFSQSFQGTFPGWRIRDIVLENSQSMFSSGEHRGKKDVLILNPMNDVLPAKLYCTVEIPKDFAGKRPMLVFEVSTKDKASDWVLAVKAMNVDMRAKTPVRCPDEAKWQPVGVDLSGLAGKRFDLSIEAYMTPKANKKVWKDERAYIRNIQLMWSGKK